MKSEDEIRQKKQELISMINESNPEKYNKYIFEKLEPLYWVLEEEMFKKQDGNVKCHLESRKKTY
jgi:hypothetical protein